MGRKIIGRKHRGIRDPERQHAARQALLADKINSPPKDNDEQTIPKSLLRIRELQTKMLKTTNPNKPRKAKQNGNERPIGIFKRRKGETDKFFLNRVHKHTEQVLKEAQFSDKYNVDIIRNKSTGEVEKLQKRPKDELEMAKNSNGKNNKKKVEPKMTKSQKKRQKLLLKKQKFMDNQVNVANDTCQIQKLAFGEVAHTPPTLTLPRMRSKNYDAASKVFKQRIINSLSSLDNGIYCYGHFSMMLR